jgi:hypothetical protein
LKELINLWAQLRIGENSELFHHQKRGIENLKIKLIKKEIKDNELYKASKYLLKAYRKIFELLLTA